MVHDGVWYIGTHSRLVKDGYNKNHFHLQIKNKNGFWEQIQWLHHSNAQNLYDGELPRVDEPEETDANIPTIP